MVNTIRRMNKSGGALFDIFWIVMAIIGSVIIVMFIMNLFGSNDIESLCKDSCEIYDYNFYSVEELVYESSKCWCLDENKPHQVPFNKKEEGWIESKLPDVLKWVI